MATVDRDLARECHVKTVQDGKRSTDPLDADNTSITDPMGRTEVYAYDLFGNMKSKTDKKGAVFTFDYSPEGMLLSRTIQKYGETDSTSYTYDVLGNVRSASAPSGTRRLGTYIFWLLSIYKA